MSLTNPSRTYKPFLFPWAMAAANRHELIHWHEDELDLQGDVNQWNDGTLLPHQKNHITQILRLFTQTDANVAGNYCDFFIPIFKNNEVRCMLLAFAAREGIHQRAYALLNDTLGLPESEFTAFLEYDEMAKKAAFMVNNSSGTPRDIAMALAKAVVNEGVALFSAFIMLLTYVRFGLMIGMTTVVEWSIRDETEHVDGISNLFREFIQEHPEILDDQFKFDVYQMFRDAVDLEDKFIDLAFEQGDAPGLTAQETKDYVRYIANRRLLGIGFKENWADHEDNPLPWVPEVLGDQMSNFFEKRVTDYSAVPFSGDWGWDSLTPVV
jgi:glutaredoxin 3